MKDEGQMIAAASVRHCHYHCVLTVSRARIDTLLGYGTLTINRASSLDVQQAALPAAATALECYNTSIQRSLII
jgi:hypothetical protein